MHQVVTLDRVGELSHGRAGAVDPPSPAAGHALVRVRRVGLCGTDFHAYRGRQPFVTYPRILGHELGVEILALPADSDSGSSTGSGTRSSADSSSRREGGSGGTDGGRTNGGPSNGEHGLAVGDRCAVEPYLHCGECHACRAGRTNCCVSLRVLGVHVDGGLQEVLQLPIAKLHPSRTLSFDELALVEPLSIGAHAVRRAQLARGELVLAIGCGPIGYATMAAACAAGARVWGLDVSEERLQFCASRLPLAGALRIRPGAPAHAAAAQPDLAAQVREALRDEASPPGAIFDATGNAGSMTKAFDLLPAGARLIFVGLVRDAITFDDPEFHRRELTLLASRNATAEDFRQVMTWIETSRLNAQALVTHRVPFARLVEEFPSLLDQGPRVFKTLVEFPV